MTLSARKHLLFPLLILCCGVTSALWPQRAAAAPPKKAGDPEWRKGRETLVIDGAWKFLTDPGNSGEQESWEKAIPASAKETVVPSLWTVQTAPGYNGVGWYWNEFEPAVKWKKQTVRLRFEAVAERATVWLNGTRIGQHEGGATPFEFNVTKALQFGAKNTLAVRVEGEAKRGAGVWQGVLLLAHDEAYLADVFPTAGGLGQLSTAVTLENTSTNSGIATLEGRVIALDKPGKDVHRSEQSLSLTPGRNITTLFTSVKGKNLRQWNTESPILYALQLAFRQGLDVLDTQETIFGFREFGWKDNALTLNGIAFKPLAVAPRFPLPVVIASTQDAERARTSFQRLKEAGVNLIYLDAPHPELLRIADELGILIVESPRKELTGQAAQKELRDLMERDRFHPCLFAWRLREGDNQEITALRSLDTTRFFLLGEGPDTKLFSPDPTQKDALPPPTGLLPTL